MQRLEVSGHGLSHGYHRGEFSVLLSTVQLPGMFFLSYLVLCDGVHGQLSADTD
jgi:hypothetical protein